MNQLKATPIKLHSGDWGARVQGSPVTGDIIGVTAKNGKTWEAEVKKIVWTDGSVTIVATGVSRGLSMMGVAVFVAENAEVLTGIVRGIHACSGFVANAHSTSTIADKSSRHLNVTRQINIR